MNNTVRLPLHRQVNSTKAVLAWATQFGKLNRGGMRRSFVEVGANVVTSRLPNALSVHGGGWPRYQTIARVMGAQNHPSVVEYLQEHCRHRLAAGKCWVGTKIGLRIDPMTLIPAAIIDLDQAIVRAAEYACQAAGETYYKEPNLTFIMGVHVGVKGRPAPWKPVFQRVARPAKNPPRQYIHVHLLLLPQAAQPALTSDAETGLEAMSMPAGRNIIAALHDDFRHRLEDEVTVKRPQPALVQAIPRMEPRLRVAALAAWESFPWHAGGLTFPDLVKDRVGILAEFSRQRQALTDAELDLQFKSLANQFVANTSLTIFKIRTEVKPLVATFKLLSKDWSQYQADKRETLRQLLRSPGTGAAVAFYDTPTAKAQVTSQDFNCQALPPGRGKSLDVMLAELALMKRVIKIVLLALASAIELKASSHTGATLGQRWFDPWLRKSASSPATLPASAKAVAKEINQPPR